MLAYVLLQVSTGRSGEVVTWLRQLNGVSEAYAIYGDHDVIAKADVADSRDLDSLIMETVQRNPHVGATTTFIAMEGYPRVRRRRAVGKPKKRTRPTIAEASVEAPTRRRRARRATGTAAATGGALEPPA